MRAHKLRRPDKWADHIRENTNVTCHVKNALVWRNNEIMECCFGMGKSIGDTFSMEIIIRVLGEEFVRPIDLIGTCEGEKHRLL